MHNFSDSQALEVCFQIQNHIPLWKLYKALEKYTSILALFQNRDEFSREFALSEAQKSFLKGLKISDGISLLSKIKEKNIAFLRKEDPNYPKDFLHLNDPPFFLFYRGEASLLQHHHQSLTVVGTRKMTGYGKKVLQKILPELIQKNFAIVSGLANGIDSYSHHITFENQGHAIAFLPQGVEEARPKTQKPIYELLVQDGLVVSEFPFAPSFYSPKLYWRRNRLMSAFGQGVLVVEAAEKSGSFVTVRYALEQGKSVFAVPGEVFSKVSIGCHKLIRDGATLVENADDIFKEWNISIKNHDHEKCIHEFSNSYEKDIYEFCKIESRSLDDLISVFEKPVYEILPLLTEMEMKNMIDENQGWFRAKI